VSTGTVDDRGTWERWYSLATTFVAPATFVTALLFYFGYVSSRAQFRYFGVDVDTIGLSTRDYVMRSPQVLLVPALVLTLLGAGLVALSRLLDARGLTPATLRRARAVASLVVLAGLGLLFGYAWLGSWPAYPLLTPLVLACGLIALSWLWSRTGVAGGAVVFTVLAAALCVFWATATVAQWTGLGVAHRTARNLEDLPEVILDTPERLYTTDGVVEESALPREPEQRFRYRYRGLRLLIQAGDRMFLVPERWTPADSTYLVPIDDVRVRFRFADQPPG